MVNNKSIVTIGSLVKIKYIDTNEVAEYKIMKLIREYVPVAGNGVYYELAYREEITTLPDLQAGEISDESPLGKALIGSKVGEIRRVVIPKKSYEVLILDIIDGLSINFSSRISQLTNFCDLHNLKFNDISLLDIAFTHTSYVNEHIQEELESNERLEFLGDSVLEQSVRMYLYEKFRNHDQGDLTFFKETYVKKHAVYIYGVILNLKDYLLIGNGINLDYERVGIKIIGDAFEALMGAIALDLGFDKAHEFFLKQVIPCTNKMIS